MATLPKQSTKKHSPVRFLGFSGGLMIFSDSPLIVRRTSDVPENKPITTKRNQPKI